MTKSTLLIIAMAMALSSLAQNEILHQLELKGGYLIDLGDQRIPFIEENFENDFRLNYQGLRYIVIGYTRTKDKTKLGIEIDYFKFRRLSQDFIDFADPFFPGDRSNEQIQLAIFYGRSIINTKKVDFYIARITSIALRTNTIKDSNSHEIPIRDYVIGLGGKLQVNFSINEKLSLSLGSKLMVLDYFVRSVGNSIERTKHFDFVRGDVVIQTGIVYTI